MKEKRNKIIGISLIIGSIMIGIYAVGISTFISSLGLSVLTDETKRLIKRDEENKTNIPS